MQQKLSALWIVGWFPSSVNHYAGNFIKRHALACSDSIDIHILYAATHSFGEAPVTPLPTLNNSVDSDHLHFISIPQFQNKVFKPLNIIIYYFLYWRFAKHVALKIQHIDVLHLHVPDKCGFIAVWLKKLLKVPLVLTEHWAIYNTPVADHFLARNAFFRFHFKYVWKHVDSTAQVSLQLHTEMEKLLGCPKPVVYFPNVVTSDFALNEKIVKPELLTFVHVSNGEPRKNIALIFASALKLVENGISLNLKFIGFEGHLADHYKEEFANIMAASCHNSNSITSFTWEVLGKKSPSEINDVFQNSHALIMASSSENAPCVISEALCAGLPVISSNVGGISEMINQENGILIDLEMENQSNSTYNKSNIESLYQAMHHLNERLLEYDGSNIAKNASAIYRPTNVSKVLTQLYLGL